MTALEELEVAIKAFEFAAVDGAVLTTVMQRWLAVVKAHVKVLKV